MSIPAVFYGNTARPPNPGGDYSTKKKFIRKNVLIVIVIILIAFYTSTCYYIGAKLLFLLQFAFPGFNAFAFWVLFCAIALSPVIAILLSGRALKPPVQHTAAVISLCGDYWMGVYMYSVLISALTDLILLIARLTGMIASPLPESVRITSYFIIVIAVFAVCSYGANNAKTLKATQYTVPVKKGSSEMTLALISDIHLGFANNAAVLEKIVAQVNATKPDIVCIAGDFFTSCNALINPDNAAEVFRSIQSACGVYACLGNHDAGGGYEKIKDFIEKSGIHLLEDDVREIEGRAVIVGRKDSRPIGDQGEPRASIEDKLKALDSRLPVIVLDHTPDKISEYGADVDLILCGHTHHGQVFPGNLITGAIFEVDYGMYRRDENSPHVIVTSGASTWGPPMRIASRNEVVKIVLTPERA